MENKQFEYTIGEKTYVMKPLVMGQINQLINLLKEIDFPEELNVMSIVMALGDKLPKAIAIILHEPDVALKNKNIEVLGGDLAFELSPELTMEIVENFFDCTPVSSLLEKMAKTIESVVEKVNPKTETGSNESV